VLVEQVRYYFSEENRASVLEARRQESSVRETLGLSPGLILLADAAPPDEPMVEWQCGYEDESAMANAEQILMGSAEYGAARDRLAGLVTRVELDLLVSE